MTHRSTSARDHAIAPKTVVPGKNAATLLECLTREWRQLSLIPIFMYGSSRRVAALQLVEQGKAELEHRDGPRPPKRLWIRRTRCALTSTWSGDEGRKEDSDV